jgi:thioredoxin reductase (NADPH)
MRTPQQIESMFPVADRSAQRFPQLNALQLQTVKRFVRAEERAFAPEEVLFDVGQSDVPAWFLTDGTATMFGRDGFDQESQLRALESGQFTGELHQLASRPTLTGTRAGPDGCRAVPLYAADLRSLIVGSADVGELIMRAFILRRVGLLEAGVGPVLLGRAGSASLLRLQGFLSRSAYPHLVIDCSSSRGQQLIGDLALPADDLPLLVCPCGRLLKHPSNEEAAAWLGINPPLSPEVVHDVAVIGAGPAGLATAVYAASEGLSVLVIDRESLGGQAGASARIENYLGFPTGISGAALTGRALNQAQKFGAEVAIPVAASQLAVKSVTSRPDALLQLGLSDSQCVLARTVVIASGAKYKRPAIANLHDFEGVGVHYWASPVESKLCAGEEVVLVGAGNSAGQAAVFLAPQVKRLYLMVRGSGLEASMSKYLIQRIAALDNVELHVGHELTELHGTRLGGLEGATFKDRASGATKRLPVRHVFMFIGAEPNTSWLNGCVTLDDKGYVVTGAAAALAGDGASVVTHPLETSLPRVFAIGDVRSGSTKRVASAVGEGAAVVAQIHSVLGAAVRLNA